MIEVCNECSNKSIFVRKENKSEFRLKNLSKMYINEVQVDGCLIQEEQQKCDWIYEIACHQVKKVIYIELKGKHLQHALEQILNTVIFCEREFGHDRCERIACVVLTSYPQVNSAIQNRKRELQRKNIKLKTSTMKLEIKI